MICYKGFNKNWTCTKGKGSFQYRVGETYHENECKCAKNGFHCVEEPIEVFRWYQGNDARYAMVDAFGDINETDDKIACTDMTIIRALTAEQIAAHECIWLAEHPEREYSDIVCRGNGKASYGICVVRGKHPKAMGMTGDVLCILQEYKGSKEIKRMGMYKIDGKEYKPDTYYNVEGKEVGKRCAKKSSEASEH